MANIYICATKVVDESETHVLYTVQFARKSYGLRELNKVAEMHQNCYSGISKVNLSLLMKTYGEWRYISTILDPVTR
jgi:hypothetical protein